LDIEPTPQLKGGNRDETLLRLGILPQGYLYPKQERAVRDLLRKRSQLLRHRTANLLSIQNLALKGFSYKVRPNQMDENGS